MTGTGGDWHQGRGGITAIVATTIIIIIIVIIASVIAMIIIGVPIGKSCIPHLHLHILKLLFKAFLVLFQLPFRPYFITTLAETKATRRPTNPTPAAFGNISAHEICQSLI